MDMVRERHQCHLGFGQAKSVGRFALRPVRLKLRLCGHGCAGGVAQGRRALNPSAEEAVKQLNGGGHQTQRATKR